MFGVLLYNFSFKLEHGSISLMKKKNVHLKLILLFSFMVELAKTKFMARIGASTLLEDMESEETSEQWGNIFMALSRNSWLLAISLNFLLSLFCRRS